MELNKAQIGIIILAIIGIAISSYIVYYEHFILPNNQKGICDINNTFSCSDVYKSDYAKMLGINISILGILFYTGILILAIKKRYVEFLFLSSLIGFLYSLYLTFYVELFALKIFCIFCLSSALLSTLIFILSIMFRKSTLSEK